MFPVDIESWEVRMRVNKKKAMTIALVLAGLAIVALGTTMSWWRPRPGPILAI